MRNPRVFGREFGYSRRNIQGRSMDRKSTAEDSKKAIRGDGDYRGTVEDNTEEFTKLESSRPGCGAGFLDQKPDQPAWQADTISE